MILSGKKRFYLLCLDITIDQANPVGKYFQIAKNTAGHKWELTVSSNYWHERRVFQGSAFGRSTAGNDVVATKNDILLARAGGVPAVRIRAVDCWQ